MKKIWLQNRRDGKIWHRMAVLACVVGMCVCGCAGGTDNGNADEISDTSDVADSEVIRDGEDFEIGETEAALLEQQVSEKLASMTLEEKVAQIFIITPETLTDSSDVTQAGERTKAALDKYPIGGFIYFKDNIVSEEQVTAMIAAQQQYSRERIGLPLFISVDEEGGKVARIGGCDAIDVPRIENAAEIGSSGNSQEAYEAGDSIGEYLARMGFNLDYAPVADVLTNPENTVVKDRSFGNNPALVSEMVLENLAGLEENGVYGCVKHFPGHGATTGDTHEGYAYTNKTWTEMKENEIIPFRDAIEQGVDFVMVGHISCPNITGDNTPASLSKIMIEDYLKGELGYENIVITDALNMQAVTEQYSSAEAAVTALHAGVDILLIPEDFHEAYEGVVDAVQQGELTEERIDASVEKILRAKMRMGE